MTYEAIREAAEAGANRSLGNNYTDVLILELVNEICDINFNEESTIGKVIITAYTSADAYTHSSTHTASQYDAAVKYGIAQAEKHPYYRDVEGYYADVEPTY